MLFSQQLQSAVLLRRYKRFLADVRLPNGKDITVHCPNSGSMLGCSTPGSPVMISAAANRKRKYSHTLEMVLVDEGWVGINTSLTNHLVHEAFEKGRISEINTIQHIQREIKTSDHTRLDFKLITADKDVYVEVKNCSLVDHGIAMFPDAVTSRGTKHLLELLTLKQAGNDAAVLFCIQRQDSDFFSPASKIDPEYAETLAKVKQSGVMVLAYEAAVSPERVEITNPLPVII